MAAKEHGRGDIFQDSEVPEGSGLLKGADYPFDADLVRPEANNILAMEKDGAAIGTDAADDAEEGALARSIWANQSNDFPFGDVEINTVQGSYSSKALGNSLAPE